MTKALSFDQFNTPLGEKAYRKLIGKIEQESSSQVIAADSADDVLWHATFDGQVGDLFATIKALPAVNESMSFDVKKNGTSILTAPYVATSVNTTTKTIDLYASIDPAKRSFVVGDVFTVTRDYTAGGGPTPIANNTVYIEPTVGPYVD